MWLISFWGSELQLTYIFIIILYGYNLIRNFYEKLLQNLKTGKVELSDLLPPKTKNSDLGLLSIEKCWLRKSIKLHL